MGIGESRFVFPLELDARLRSRRDTEEAATANPELDGAAPAASFEAFYLASYDSLVRLAYVLTSSREVAEDLCAGLLRPPTRPLRQRGHS